MTADRVGYVQVDEHAPKPEPQKSYCNVVSCHEEPQGKPKPFCAKHYREIPPASRSALDRLYDGRKEQQSALYLQTAITVAKNLDIAIETRRFHHLRRNGFSIAESKKQILAERQEHRKSKAVLLNPALAEVLYPQKAPEDAPPGTFEMEPGQEQTSK